ncbi:Putative uncharacterized protein [Moritella viscosa]|uniref:DUF2897 family protein n=1 Tax=Moritella viscosa TaxID=80854 RepID=UPI000917A9BB|nr:DUF2897 family protein [Moritella viscosa]SGY92835.1 Putative uncharacterized protein [Moritella viscosa]
MVWLIILVALGFILGSIMALKYTANMKMKIPEEIEHQFNKKLHLDAGENAKALADDDEQQEYNNEYRNEYDKNPMPDDDKKDTDK